MASAPPAPTGLLSGVFTFVSRELESFVTNATGASVSSSQRSTEPGPSKRANSGNLKRTVRRRGLTIYPNPHDTDHFKGKRKTRRDEPDYSVISPERHRPRRSTEGQSKHQGHVSVPAASVDQADEDETTLSNAVGTNNTSSPFPSQAPMPQFLHRHPPITMPGSLFPRSASLQPDSTPSPPQDDERHVHFPNPRSSNQKRVPLQQSSKNSSSSRLVPDRPRRTNVYPDLSGGDGDHKIQNNDIGGSEADSSESDVDSLSKQHSSSQPIRKGEQKSIERQKPLVQLSAKARGKQRAVDSLGDLDGSDTFGEIQVRGKERELIAARQEQRDRESRWELDRYRDANRDAFEAEREKDKEQIRLLEEEVRRLKDELAKRRTVEPSPRAERTPNFYMPPPPPPPPPPPDSINHLLAPTFRHRSGSGTDDFLASVRSSLKHTATPKEAPINSSYGELRAKRTGQPTVNLGTDKMAAFLSEMKSVKLRKVKSHGSLDNLAAAKTLSGQPGESVSRRLALDITDGQKRKRVESNADVVNHSLPLPKRRLATFNSSFASSSSRPAALQATARPLSVPFSKSQGSMPRIQAWGSTSTDLTPSLCSDNEHEVETAADDRFPATPPLDQPARSKPIPVTDRELQREISNTDIDLNLSLPPTSQPPRTAMKTPPPKNSTKDLFSKRPPTSPMPYLPTPKRPRKPTRSRAVLIHPPAYPANNDNDEDEDPLSLSYTVPEDLGLSAPSAPPTRQKGSNAARKARRQTLDEEIRIAEEDGIMDSGLFVGVGSRSKKRGFLAGGGAAGAPVFMGVGYVEGAEERGVEGPDGDEWKPSRTSKTTAGRGRRRR